MLKTRLPSHAEYVWFVKPCESLGKHIRLVMIPDPKMERHLSQAHGSYQAIQELCPLFIYPIQGIVLVLFITIH